MAITGVGRVAGVTNYSSGGTSKFTPQLYSKDVVVKLYPATVTANIVNNKLGGAVQKLGDTLYLPVIPTMAVNDYAVGQELDVQRPDSTGQTLVVDQGLYFAAKIDQVTKVQSQMPLDKIFMDDAVKQLAIAMDKRYLGALYAQADSTNMGVTAGAFSGSVNLGTPGAPFQLSGANIVKFLIDTSTCMDENNVPVANRYIVLPPVIKNLLYDSPIANAMFAGDAKSIVRTGGLIGNYMDWDIRVSNNLTTTLDGGKTCFYIPFGISDVCAYVKQIDEVSAVTMEKEFGTLMKGLLIYGSKAVNSLGVGCAYVSIA